MRAILAMVVLSLFGCSSATRKEAQAPPREPPAAGPPAEEASPSPAAPDAAPAQTLPTAFGREPLAPDAGAPPAGPPCEVGVPECDDYIAKYTACVSSHVPKPSRKMMEQALEKTCVTWRKLAEDPSARQALVRACRAASAAAAKAMVSLGCAW